MKGLRCLFLLAADVVRWTWRAHSCGGAALSGPLLASAQDPRAVALADLARVTGNQYCISFSPYPRGFAPNGLGGPEPPCDLVAAMLDQVLSSGKVKCILTYSALAANGCIPLLARQRNIPVIQGIFIDADEYVNGQEIGAAVFLAQNFPDVIKGGREA